MSFFRTRIDVTRGHLQERCRILAADAALEIDETDRTIILNSTTGTKAATFSFDEQTTTRGGVKFKLQLAVRSGGSYTVACTHGVTAGTVTLDAADEVAEFQRIGTTLYVIHMTGATFA